MNSKFIVWDLGATKCAAALVSVENHHYTIIKSHSVKLKQCDSLADMADILHAQLQVDFNEIDGICIAGAGQYNGEELVLENPYPFPMRFAKLAKQQNWPYFEVVHDYTPIVCSTFIDHSGKDRVRQLNNAKMNIHGRRVAFGVGTGLGVKDVVMLPSGEIWLGTNEMGHIGLSLPPKMNRVEASVHRDFVKFLQDHDELHGGCINFETVLSGKGLARIHQFIRGSKYRLTPEETVEEIKLSEDEDTLQLFAWYLGLFIGTLQLTFMPTGGIWINGGVINKNQQLFESPHFRRIWRGVKASPAYWHKRENYPVNVLVGQEHALLGSAYYAQIHFPSFQTT